MKDFSRHLVSSLTLIVSAEAGLLGTPGLMPLPQSGFASIRMPFQEILQVGWNFVEVGAVLLELVGDLFGDITRPAFGGVKCHDANRILVLPV
jgi:hypothetical protein